MSSPPSKPWRLFRISASKTSLTCVFSSVQSLLLFVWTPQQYQQINYYSGHTELLSNLLAGKFIQAIQIKSIWKQNVRCQHLKGKYLHRGALSPIKVPSIIFIPDVTSDQSTQYSGICTVSGGASVWIFRVVWSFCSWKIGAPWVLPSP